MKKALTGNEAAAEAMRQIDPDVVAAYPITPATEIVQIFSQFVADGLVETEYVPAESEHSAMSACIGAAAAGARAMTGTAAQGLALMWEMLYIASGLRLPIVLINVNRALSAPINIHCDHSDTMGARDSGWVQLYSENAQEVYDNVIQAVRIAESVRLPVMVTMDGFIISHGMEVVDILQDSEVKEFVGEPKPAYTLLDVENPITVGAIDFTDYFFEHKRQTIEAMNSAGESIDKVAKEFEKRFGRDYSFFEGYRTEGAEVAIVAIGSICGTARVVVDKLRDEGVLAGLIKLRVFRPFPARLLAEAISTSSAIGVLDRCDGLSGCGGPLFSEVKSALYDAGLVKPPPVYNFIYGLGGRDVGVEDIEAVYRDLLKTVERGRIEERVKYIGVRE
jgi:pyruvate ferredoxin oxidoreductase alpha subunit